MIATTDDNVLKRYTDFPALVYLLHNRSITLLNPETWDDSNDAYYLRLYRRKKKLESVLAICFTQAGERYHHWRVFAAGAGGICIRFRKTPLLKAINAQIGVRAGSVKYLTMKRLRSKRLTVDELPFLKRSPFRDENEYRAIYESAAKVSSFDIKISLKCIERITLSPWMHPSLAPHVKQTIKSIDGCGGLEVISSTLIGNQVWKNLGETAR